MTFLLRVETNLKLNAVDFEGHSMIDTSDDMELRKPEVHFLQMESVTNRYPMSISLFWKLIRNFRNKSLVFEDWVITDLDYALKGNPLMPPHPDDPDKKDQ
jgi:hypothetical protein